MKKLCRYECLLLCTKLQRLSVKGHSWWCCVVNDNKKNEIVWNTNSIGPIPDEIPDNDSYKLQFLWMERIAIAWLEEHYPNWQDPQAYWEEE